MLDPSENRLEFETVNSRSTEVQNQQKKSCAACGTTKTPLWRGGPAGPKSLCNACGIRSRKKRRDGSGLSRSSSNIDKKSRRGNNSSSHESNKKSNGLGNGLKLRLLGLGREVMMQRSSVEKLRRKLGEEEVAAILLMALSYGCVHG